MRQGQSGDKGRDDVAVTRVTRRYERLPQLGTQLVCAARPPHLVVAAVVAVPEVSDVQVREAFAFKRVGHRLRSHATLTPAASVHPRAVADRLGHNTVALTLEAHSRGVPSVAGEAAG